ncbi:MAG: hypothetical protein ACTSYI_12960 [Promethearchaeota archaeon]
MINQPKNQPKPSASGVLFLVVGNSGSGKDSVISGVETLWNSSNTSLPSINVPTRYITRPSHESEDFVSISTDDFHKMKNKDQFAFWWHIYELDYGVPASIFEWLEKGDFVLVNVSRNIISQVKAKIPNTQIIFVSVPFSITKARILSRGRENPDDPVFQARIERARDRQTLPEADIVIDNAGDLDNAISDLIKKLHKYLP